MKRFLPLFFILLQVMTAKAEDGYRLWLRYDKIDDPARLQQYRQIVSGIYFTGTSVAKTELIQGLEGLMAQRLPELAMPANGSVVVGRLSDKTIRSLRLNMDSSRLGTEGFALFSINRQQKKFTVITANADVGLLYGVFHLLRLIQTRQAIGQLSVVSVPRIRFRMLDHWDNLNRTVERGYAGISIWNWHTLPGYIDQRYIDYARANASIGINGTVLTNVNANALVLTKEYLEKIAALAKVFRPYGIRVYLTARFSAPIEIGGLKTADPLNEAVRKWWQDKVKEIYSYIPDFGGFLVKANSEGQPGPQNYGRNHAEGANMLAEAMKPYGGIVLWRAFVYSNETPEDRFKQAYNEFQPLDGKFGDNVLVQVKNGPIDFQPREPFHPLFGAMPKTQLAMEFQLTQEYLGFSTHLVYLPALFKEVLDAETFASGKPDKVATIIDGTASGYQLTAMAGVANIGNERNWTGHPFGQANWYGFGRLAWDHELSPEQIAEEWARQTFSNNHVAVNLIKHIMLSSREAVVNYMTPLGLHHIMGYSHHYGPAPWYDKAPRADWNPVYFHRADSIGIGFDRTATGSNALAEYSAPVRALFSDLQTCPEAYLLWFHHVRWDHRMKSGRTLWQELCFKYDAGVDSVKRMQEEWNRLSDYIDKERFRQVQMLLGIQLDEARWWRNACLLYFQTFSRMSLPPGSEQPDHTLEYYKNLRFPFAPGNG
jgi:alpha-glucuronidase